MSKNNIIIIGHRKRDLLRVHLDSIYKKNNCIVLFSEIPGSSKNKDQTLKYEDNLTEDADSTEDDKLNPEEDYTEPYEGAKNKLKAIDDPSAPNQIPHAAPTRRVLFQQVKTKVVEVQTTCLSHFYFINLFFQSKIHSGWKKYLLLSFVKFNSCGLVKWKPKIKNYFWLYVSINLQKWDLQRNYTT